MPCSSTPPSVRLPVRLVHDVDIKRIDRQADSLADRLALGRMYGKGEVLGAHHHFNARP